MNNQNLNSARGIAGPGRPKSGRSLVLDTLDRLLSDKKNQIKIFQALQERLDKDAAKFIMQFVFPLLPRDLNFNMPGDTDITLIIKNRAQQLVESIQEDVKTVVSQKK
jgi:hypothetical protein